MPITLLSSLPKHISPEEHQKLVASTPASFADIPPVLRHRQDNVSATLDPPLDGFLTEDAANGSLYVIESALVFLSVTGRGFQVDYPSITLHAISRAESGPTIYCQLDEPSAPEEEDEDATAMRELVIVPKDPSSLEPIFESLSLCASLHPDPNDDNDMDDDNDAFVDPGEFDTFNGNADEELSEVGKAALAHLESIIYDPFDKSGEQFEDAEVDQAGSESQNPDAAADATKTKGKEGQKADAA